MTEPHIVCIDGMNFIHRAKAGWKLGPAPIIFNFMKMIRSFVEKHVPSRVYFVLEGHPQQRYDAFPEYKAGRVHDPKFHEQAQVIEDILSKCFPISVVRHKDYECDDTIYNLVKRSSRAIPWTVVSNDSDFIQLLNEFKNVKLYNPMLKEYVLAPAYDYVDWKSLRGDGTDNIPGLMSDAKATSLMEDPEGLREFFKDSAMVELYTRNRNLIKLIEWDDTTAIEMTCSTPVHDWEPLNELFNEYDFNSLLKPDAWKNFITTFDPLWAEEKSACRKFES